MARCSARKSDGTPCVRIVGASQTYCYAHAPDKADARRRAASTAGKAGGNGRQGGAATDELVDIKRQLRAVLGGTFREQVDKSVAAVLFQGYNTLLRAVEIERKVHELERVEEAIAELERRVYRRGAS